jgi:hypothetical protein
VKVPTNCVNFMLQNHSENRPQAHQNRTKINENSSWAVLSFTKLHIQSFMRVKSTNLSPLHKRPLVLSSSRLYPKREACEGHKSLAFSSTTMIFNCALLDQKRETREMNKPWDQKRETREMNQPWAFSSMMSSFQMLTTISET